MATKAVPISRDAFEDLKLIRGDFEVVVESLELMENEEFMESYKKSERRNKK